MGSFLFNNIAYTIKAENQLANILSQFDTSYIDSIIDDVVVRTMNGEFDITPKVNLVNALENNFKNTLQDFPEDRKNVLLVREDCYLNILNKLGQSFNFEFRRCEEMDLYSITHLVYDFYISNNHAYFIHFISNFIMREQNMLYKVLELDKNKKNKDTTTINNKKLFKSQQLAVIASNIGYVLRYLSELDFDMEQILNESYNYNYNFVAAFLTHILPKNDPYKQFYGMNVNYNSEPLVANTLALELFRQADANHMTQQLNIL